MQCFRSQGLYYTYVDHHHPRRTCWNGKIISLLPNRCSSMSNSLRWPWTQPNPSNRQSRAVDRRASFFGWHHKSKALHLPAMIGIQSILALIDMGNTHSHLHLGIARLLKLQLKKSIQISITKEKGRKRFLFWGFWERFYC